MDHRTLAQMMMGMGRNGDSLIAHISPREAMVLKMMGGSGTVNPATGMLEFWDDGGNDPGGVGGNAGSTGAGEDSSMGGDPSVEGYGNIDPDAAQTDTMSYSDDLGAILSDMEAQAGRNNTIAEGFMANPMGYLGAAAVNTGKGIMDSIGNATLNDIPPSLAIPFFGLPGYALAAAAQGKAKDAGLATGATLGGVVGGPLGAAVGGLAGYGIGALADNFGFSEPSQESVAGMQGGGTGQGSDFSGLAESFMDVPGGVSEAQAVAQPESVDREAFGRFGTGMINSQSRAASSGAKGNAANRGMGENSGQLMAQLAIQRQQAQQKLAQWQAAMADPNLGYNDLAASLQNILA